MVFARAGQGPSRDPRFKILVIVASTVPERNVEVETARYYLPADCIVIGSRDIEAERALRTSPDVVFYATGSRKSSRPPVPESIGPYQIPRASGIIPDLNVYRGCPLIISCAGRGVVAGLEDGQRQGLEIFVEGRPGHPERLFGCRTDAQAAGLELGRNRPESQTFDDLESPLNLGIGFEALAGLCAQVFGPDRGGSRSECHPSVAGSNPEGCFHGDVAHVRRDLRAG